MFATIEALQDPESGMDVAKARAIASLGSVLVESAKVEIEFLKEVGGLGSGFIDDGENRHRIESAAKPMLPFAAGNREN